MIPFNFEGKIPVSKSLFIRQAVCRSHGRDFLNSQSAACRDINHVLEGVSALKEGKDIDCGDGAAVFRFLSLRASREEGSFFLAGSQSLMSRPQEELRNIFSQLGVDSELNEKGIRIQSKGWRNSGIVTVNRSISSQFASAILLNAWNLSFPLRISWSGPTVSDGYWDMSVAIVESMGMQLKHGSGYVGIPAHQVPAEINLFEPDMSSAFAVAALAAAGGQCRILDFPNESLQPDSAFINVLRAMGATVVQENNFLEIRGPKTLLPVDVNLKDSPDMFPVLALLCAFAKGKSRLMGAPQLVYKESNRLEKTFELLQKVGREFEPLLDGAVILGHPFNPQTDNRFSIPYDPENDHRLVMAACVARQFGFNIRIDNINVVDKSFPEFKEIARL